MEQIKTPLEFLLGYLPMPVIWGANRILGSMLAIKMGDKIEEISRRDGLTFAPSHYMAIECCAWQLFDDGVEVLNNDCEDDAVYEGVLSKLIGQRIVNITVYSEPCEARIDFDGGHHFLIQADDYYDPEVQLFWFYEDNQKAVRFSEKKGLFYSD